MKIAAFLKSVEVCVPTEAVLDALRAARLAEAKRIRMARLFSEYSATTC